MLDGSKISKESYISIYKYKCAYIFIILILLGSTLFAQKSIRKQVPLNDGWLSTAEDSSARAFNGFEQPSFSTKKWKPVTVPHNWDGYEGYRRLRHGNRHGYAAYRKSFSIQHNKTGKRFFLFFEGVGSYATVWLNGKQVGYHAGGRTTFTIDVTNIIYVDGRSNLLAVQADHPANIADLPWVCGGCSDERGFSEGSQPMGIFRPVSLVITNETVIAPFGVFAWNDTTINEKQATVNISTTIRYYGNGAVKTTIESRLLNAAGKLVALSTADQQIKKGDSLTVPHTLWVKDPLLWSPDAPNLYTLVSRIIQNGQLVDEQRTPYGIRKLRWPAVQGGGDRRFFVNDKPVFINGVAEYEHIIGNSHAFSAAQVKARAMQVKATGFNAFRDAHQPHNLRYQQYWDSLGILWWTQLSAHVWYDTPEFRTNFKNLLREWVLERRNSPSVIMYGLQNESKLPEDFARECTVLIRELDPTASTQRLVSTCNGGSGTDWDVPQNWTGTYGGNPNMYGADLIRQNLAGEYGAWRTLDLHTEGGFDQNGVYSEDRMTQLMEMKVRQAEAVKDSVSGHFFWLLTSHDNPGRVQGGEGLRELDRIGPVNYKGLMTPWEEPLDVFYMFRANYVSRLSAPMVYIVSHTWPQRWTTPGIRNGLTVYSNCDEVELLNDVDQLPLGKQKRNGTGTHFAFNNIAVNYNVLTAVGYVNGKRVAKDRIILQNLPQAPHFSELYAGAINLTKPAAGYKYLYRVNCGGGDYIDENNNLWMADRRQTAGAGWGSTSWTDGFNNMPPYFASQRQTNDPIAGTKDWPLFQTFRYGRDKLHFNFPVPDGEYLVELYFAEPWHGRGDGMNCNGWRVFDVAVNDKIVLHDLDLWETAGHAHAVKRSVQVKITGGNLAVSFPHVEAGQAVISAIAIASAVQTLQPSAPSPLIITQANSGHIKTWMNTGNFQYEDAAESFVSLPPALYGAEWIQMKQASRQVSFAITADADVFIAIDEIIKTKPAWLTGFDDIKAFVQNSTGKKYNVYRQRFGKGSRIELGENPAGATMYLVAVNDAASIEPAYDLKAVTNYKAHIALFKGTGIVKSTVNDKDAATFTHAAGDTLEWKFETGVADIYSLTIKYVNPLMSDMKATLRLLAEDGTLLRTEQVLFTPTKTGKWNYLSTSTGSMINAGAYRLQLIPGNAVGLGISGLEVQ